MEAPPPQTNKPNLPLGSNMDALQLLDRLLSNEHIDEGLAMSFWSLFSNSLKLSNLSPDDITAMKIDFKLLRLAYIQSLPAHSFSNAEKMMLKQVEIEFDSNLCRAKGGFERIYETAQINADTDKMPFTPTVENAGILTKFGRVVGGIFGGGGGGGGH